MLKKIDRLLEAFVAALMGVIWLVVFLGVTFRYVLNSPLGWTEEIGRMALVWVTFIGAYLALRRVEHMRIDALYKKGSPKARATMDIVGAVVLTVLFVAFMIEGISYARQFMGDTTPCLGIPLGLSYTIMPLMSALCIAALWTGVLGRGHTS